MLQILEAAFRIREFLSWNTLFSFGGGQFSVYKDIKEAECDGLVREAEVGKRRIRYTEIRDVPTEAVNIGPRGITLSNYADQVVRRDCLEAAKSIYFRRRLVM
ncbi:hypothetical protein PF002_g9548 [Phytophthora fragariae]|uniref:Uncharacterized protein n=1 Tax=Phytophthora fragariae TaxID=53985 RepID=A0A6A3ZT45_9STRA|nr:hypothetical protein PF002_g9548 [Phytophthora fragariae]